MTRKRLVFLPELVEGKDRAWHSEEVEIRNSAVNLQTGVAYVPRPLTPAQELARKHEMLHVKYTPSSLRKPGYPERVARIAGRIGERADPKAILRLLKMLEENRVDWIGWDRHEIDLRPAREALDWKQWPDPETLLQATATVLQLAWTVWASRGLGKGIPNEPPVRPLDPDTAECFDKAWKYICDESPDLSHAIIKGCLEMYQRPTNARRDQVAYELAQFFLLPEEQEQEAPPEKPEEKEKQKEVEEKEAEADKQKEEEETGHGSPFVTEGGVQYHDHTASIKRPTMRVVRRHVPVFQGLNLKYPHRYLMDKAVFGERRLTEGGIMIDGSGSMHWEDADLKGVLEKLPAVTVGIYSGFDGPRGSGVYGRICTLAKKGRFCKFTGKDEGTNARNSVDYEALKLLAKWPAPRLWLSDGMVCGGKYDERCEHEHHWVGEYGYSGKLHEMCNAVMKAHNILRVHDRETLMRLLKRERVTLFRSCTTPMDRKYGYAGTCNWPTDILPMPTQFQL